MDKTKRGSLIYKEVLCFLFGALIILGIIVLHVSVFVGEFNLRNESVTVEATVTGCSLISEHEDVDGRTVRKYDVRLSYEYDNKSYESVLHNSGKYDRGDLLKIHIDPQRPEENYGKNQGIFDFLWPFLISVPLSFFGVYLLRRGISYSTALCRNTNVTARVSELGTEDCEDSDGRSWIEYCVYVDYEYDGKKYEKIYWYGAQTKNKTVRRLTKELSRFPKKGETFQIYINPQKPNEVLSKAPFRIIN